MIQFLLEGIASFIGGYFSQKTQDGKISIKKFFFIIFMTLEGVAIVSQIDYGKFIIEDALFGLGISLFGATFCTLLLYFWLKFRRKKLSGN